MKKSSKTRIFKESLPTILPKNGSQKGKLARKFLFLNIIHTHIIDKIPPETFPETDRARPRLICNRIVLGAKSLLQSTFQRVPKKGLIFHIPNIIYMGNYLDFNFFPYFPVYNTAKKQEEKCKEMKKKSK